VPRFPTLIAQLAPWASAEHHGSGDVLRCLTLSPDCRSRTTWVRTGPNRRALWDRYQMIHSWPPTLEGPNDAKMRTLNLEAC